MNKKITKEEVAHIAHLARLKLTDNEIDLFSEQLGRIIQYVGQLRENQFISQDIPLLHSKTRKNALREDVVKEFENKEEVLKNAPNRFEDFFKVKKVIE